MDKCWDDSRFPPRSSERDEEEPEEEQFEEYDPTEKWFKQERE